MRKIRSKQLRKEIDHLLLKFGEQIKEQSQAMLNQPNRNGYRQHRVISPRRQVKKQILRHQLTPQQFFA